MANYVKISTVGVKALSVNEDLQPQQVVDKMIPYLKEEVEQVLPDRPDLIVLPEACDRPMNWQSTERKKEYYRTRGDQVLDVLATVARDNNCYVAYPALREMEEDHSWRNSTIILDRSGDVAGIYNKNHVVVNEYSDMDTLYGKDAPIIQCDFGRVACLICFDLNFDELRLKYVKAKPDLLIFSSMYHGGLMQGYWAYSCRSHLVSAICGLPSRILSPLGEAIASSTNYYDYATATVNLDCCLAHLDWNKERFKALKAKYGPGVKITVPPYLACAMISSETDEVGVQEMVKEFGIELLDDYFARSLADRRAPGHIET